MYDLINSLIIEQFLNDDDTISFYSHKTNTTLKEAMTNFFIKLGFNYDNFFCEHNIAFNNDEINIGFLYCGWFDCDRIHHLAAITYDYLKR